MPGGFSIGRSPLVSRRANFVLNLSLTLVRYVSRVLPGPINWAYAGEHRWQRDADSGEDLEAFVQRAAKAAIAAGETSMNVGGLPRSDELAQYKTFEELWAVIGVDYPEVPPCEGQGYERRSSPYGGGC